MTRPFEEHDVIPYLSLGFRPDVDEATRYIDQVCLRREPLNTVEEAINFISQYISSQTNAEEIFIPLTGGQDSRGILGAALRTKSAEKIQCVTVGAETHHDVVVAKAVCHHLGVRHLRLDPNLFEWDLDKITEVARRRFRRCGNLPPIDGLVMFESIAGAIPYGAPVISGYLGDATSGAHLPMDSKAPIVPAFLRMNQELLGNQSFENFFSKFVDRNSSWIKQTGADPFDVLDFGFRQRMRIRGVATSAFQRCIMPYEQPEWVAFWLSRPRSERVGQRLYREAYRRLFPSIFDGYFGLLSRAGRLLRRVSGRAPRAPTETRGDPRRNQSMANAIVSACAAFDARGLLAPMAATAAREFVRHPTRENFLISRWCASAEVMLRVASR